MRLLTQAEELVLLAEMAGIQAAMWADTPWPEPDGEEA
jgi:hypothetical protein